MSDWIEVSEGGAMWDQTKPIQGVYKRKESNVGPNNSMKYVLDVDGNETGVWGSTVIDSKFEQIPVGSEVRIEFLGKKKGQRGNEYKDYKFQYRKTAESVVADTFGGGEVL